MYYTVLQGRIHCSDFGVSIYIINGEIIVSEFETLILHVGFQYVILKSTEQPRSVQLDIVLLFKNLDKI